MGGIRGEEAAGGLLDRVPAEGAHADRGAGHGGQERDRHRRAPQQGAGAAVGGTSASRGVGSPKWSGPAVRGGHVSGSWSCRRVVPCPVGRVVNGVGDGEVRPGGGSAAAPSAFSAARAILRCMPPKTMPWKGHTAHQ